MNPNYLLDRKNSSITVIYHRFILLSSKCSTETIYCFYEGKDDSTFYHNKISLYFSKIESIVCKGKKNVIGIYNFLATTEHLKTKKIAFFIDKDFDEECGIIGIFETDYYSIENYYSGDYTLEFILKNEFKLDSADIEYSEIMEFFKKRQNEFHNSVLLYNAWYSCIKKKNDHTVSLNDSFPKSFLRFDLDNEIVPTYTLKEIEMLHQGSMKIASSEIEEAIDNFKKKNLYSILRGKWEIQFMRSFLRFLIKDAKDLKSQKFISKKITFNFQDDLFISQLSQYSETPGKLLDYLTQIKNQECFA